MTQETPELSRRDFNLGMIKAFCALGLARSLALPVGLRRPDAEYLIVRDWAYGEDWTSFEIHEIVDGKGKIVETKTVTGIDFAKDSDAYQNIMEYFTKKYDIHQLYGVV